MAAEPGEPKIYHITHWHNLPSIIEHGGLWSDAQRLALGLECELVGLSGIKQRRLRDLTVKCHPMTKVGEYVPFYFCPRSIMLYILHMGNHPELTYGGGQQPIVHLEADLGEVVTWAESEQRLWAFSNGNAGAKYTDFYASLTDLRRLDWAAIAAADWRADAIKERKQAEFLLHEWFPWHLVERIGVQTQAVAKAVRGALAPAAHQPPVGIQPAWYY